MRRRTFFALVAALLLAVPALAQEEVAMPAPELLGPQSTILLVFLAVAIVIALVFGMVGLSTRTAANVNVNKAYQLRRVLFFTTTPLLVALLAVTLPQAPYAGADARPDRIVYVAARQYNFMFSDDSIVTREDVARVRRIPRLELEAGELVEFRVTSLDVTHGFGIYGPEHQLLAQTQAMPGYVNRLLVRLERPGPYFVLCLEYCARGHHGMSRPFVVNSSNSLLLNSSN